MQTLWDENEIRNADVIVGVTNSTMYQLFGFCRLQALLAKGDYSTEHRVYRYWASSEPELKDFADAVKRIRGHVCDEQCMIRPFAEGQHWIRPSQN